MISICRAITDAIRQASEWPPDVKSEDIRNVEFHKGCAEIEVIYRDRDDDYMPVIIDAAPVLSALLQKLVDQEQHDDFMSKLAAASDV